MPAPVPNRSQRRRPRPGRPRTCGCPPPGSASPRVGVDPADRTAVRPARRRSRARRWPAARWTWAPRTPSPAGASRASISAPAHARPQPSRHRRDEVDEPRVLLDGAQRRRPDRARPADVGQVVAHQVDDHDVLGVVLGQHGRPGPGRPLDRARLHEVTVAAQEQLGRGADHLEAGLRHVDQAGVRRRVALRRARRQPARSAVVGQRVRTARGRGSPGRPRRRRSGGGCRPRLRGRPVRPASCARPSPAQARWRPVAAPPAGAPRRPGTARPRRTARR